MLNMCCARSCANPTERQLVRWRKASVCLVSHLGETSSASSCIFGHLRASSGVFARLSAIKGRGLRNRSRNRERVLDCLFQLAHKIKQIHKLRFLPLHTTSAYGKEHHWLVHQNGTILFSWSFSHFNTID
jgi:hypothetical protein